MESSAALHAGERSGGEGEFGAGRLFLLDSRLALVVLNQVRYLALNRLLGVPREQANLVTVLLGLIAADATYVGARRLARPSLPVSGADAAILSSAIREGVLRVGGPRSREVPLFATLVGVAMIGGVALPGLRRRARAIREAEQRLRLARVRRYAAATRRGDVSAG
jgi:hypothetical protein